MFPLDLSYLRPSLGDANRLYWRHVGAYIQKVKAIETPDLIGYWPMNEPSGSVALDKSAQRNNGAYTGVTLGETGIGDGETCPLFDGANDFNNLYSTAFNSDFDGKEGTVAVWLKVIDDALWTDGSVHRSLNLEVDGNNFVSLRKTAVNRQLSWFYKASGTEKRVDLGSLTELDWIHMALTWSLTGDAVKAYYQGIQTGSTLTGLGTWAGNLASTGTCIGARNVTPNNPWDGWLAQVPIWTKALTPAQILSLATV